jgi:hypothetical protein
MHEVVIRLAPSGPINRPKRAALIKLHKLKKTINNYTKKAFFYDRLFKKPHFKNKLNQ